MDELIEAARANGLFPLHVYLGAASDLDVAYFRLANEFMADVGPRSPMPIMNLNYYVGQLSDADLPGERGQVLILEAIDGLASQLSSELDGFALDGSVWVLWGLYSYRVRYAAATGELHVLHSVLTGSPGALDVVWKALERRNRELEESPYPWVEKYFKPVPLVKVT